MIVLQHSWLVILWIFFIGYLVLDGFDLGAGFWHLLTRGEEERRMILNAIGPFWDGNEVWLITGGASLFAAFPPVYATIFSGFYLALIVLLAGFMFRAIAIELRGKEPSPRIRGYWDIAFAVGSIVITLLLGVAWGNILRGLPLDQVGNNTGSFFDLLNPYSLLIGVFGIALLATHGALWIALKTSGDLPAKARRWAGSAWIGTLLLALSAILVTPAAAPHLLTNYMVHPLLWLLPALTALALLLIKVYSAQQRDLAAFLASVCAIGGFIISSVTALYPRMVPADNPQFSLTLSNASSSFLTLKVMLIIVIIGLPFIVGYTVFTHRLFAARVTADQFHY